MEVITLQKIKLPGLKIISCILIVFTMVFSSADISSATHNYDMKYYSKFKDKKIELNVYNWGEYMATGSDGSTNINKEFEKLTGIKINYSNYETNEGMYAKLKSKSNNYDVIFPSDYMIAKMIDEKMLEKINFDNIPNYKYIDPNLLNPIYDKSNQYSVPYAWGITALIYNKKSYSKPPSSWKSLWDKNKSKKILMFKNSRDAFAISEAVLGYDINTENEKHLKESLQLLKKQKPVLQAYVMDQIFDKMQGEEADIAPCYLGDGVLMKKANKNLEIALPKETKNLFVDAICIPKGTKNKEAAEMYINFLNEPNIAADNMGYILYSTPNLAAKELLPYEVRTNPYLYPSKEILDECVPFTNLSNDANLLMDRYWSQLMLPGNNRLAHIILISLIIAMTIVYISLRHKRKIARKKYKDEILII